MRVMRVMGDRVSTRRLRGLASDEGGRTEKTPTVPLEMDGRKPQETLLIISTYIESNPVEAGRMVFPDVPFLRPFFCFDASRFSNLSTTGHSSISLFDVVVVNNGKSIYST